MTWASLASDHRPLIAGTFIENLGQWKGPAAFTLHGDGAVARLEPDGLTLWIGNPGSDELVESLELRFVGAASDVRAAGQERLPGVFHYLVGAPERWRRGVRRFARVLHHGLYEGVDLQWRSVSGHLEYDLRVDELGRLGDIVVACTGAERLSRGPRGELTIHTARGNRIVQPRPIAWLELSGGERRPVPCDYRLMGGATYGFVVPDEFSGHPLVIDPGVLWSTYLGGEFTDNLVDIEVDPSGDILVTGKTTSSDFPVTAGVLQSEHGGMSGLFPNDTFVARFDARGSELQFATFLGGSKNDLVSGLELDAGGQITLAGVTASEEFPTTPGAYETSLCGAAAFVTRLTADGTDLVWSTLVSACGSLGVGGLFLHDTGAVTIAGDSTSEVYPTTSGAFQPEPAAPGPLFRDGFVSRISADGSKLVFSTFLGGSAADTIDTLDVDTAGRIWVAGFTQSTDLPVTAGAWSAGPMRGFVGRLSPDASVLEAMTYFGGDDVQIADIAVGPAGSITVAGRTDGPDFPITPGAFDATYQGPTEGFVAKLTSGLDELLFSTWIGGGSVDEVEHVAVDSAGTPTLMGFTRSVDFPTTSGAYQTVGGGFVGGQDFFVSRLSEDGTELLSSTLLGGSEDEDGFSAPGTALWLAPDGGDVIVGGRSTYEDYPTTPGAFDTTQNGFGDAVITRLDMLPTGAARFGSSTPGCDGPLGIGVTAMPQIGAAFSVTGTNAPAAASGFLAVSSAVLTEPLFVGGAQIWIDPARVVLLPVESSGLGAVEVPFELPADPRLIDAEAALQFLWPDDCAPTWLSASSGLLVTIQGGGS